MNSAAVQFAEWLGREHPELFDAIYASAVRAGQTSHLARMHGLGDDGIDASFSDPGIVDVPVDSSLISAPDVTIDTSSSGPSFFDTAASAVGNWLTQGGGANALINLGSAVLNNKAQQTVLQTQLSRAQQAQSPLPISYVTGSNGHPQAVYQTGVVPTALPGSGITPVSVQLPPVLQQAVQSGQAQLVPLSDGTMGYTLTPSVLSALTSNSLLSNPWVIGGGLVLLALLLS